MNDKIALSCPECHHLSLREAVRYDVEIDACSNCFGIWFDADEMIAYARGRKELKQESAPPAEPFIAELNSVPGKCPRCRCMSLQLGAAGWLEMQFCVQCKGVYLPVKTHRAIFEPPEVPGIKEMNEYPTWMSGRYGGELDILSALSGGWFL